MFDFAVLPPEVNSTRIYTGPGPGPMLAAAVAWSAVAVELESAALGYSRAIVDLTATWQGPAALCMVGATAPVTAWLHTSAAAAEQTAAQATAAAGAFELAFATVVPPPVIAANRALLMTLVATNFFGQNTPAIAATESHYLQMWIQDAVAMYTYAGSSAAASPLNAFATPPQHTNPAALGAQAAAVAHAAAAVSGAQPTTLPQLMATTPSVLQQLAAPPMVTSPTLLDYLEHVPNLINTMLSTNNAVASVRSIDITNQRLAFQATRDPAPPLLVAAPAVTAESGAAPSIGGLSVPASWGCQPPAVRPMALALPTSGAPPPPAATPMPGGTFAPAGLAALQRPQEKRRPPTTDPVLVRPAAAR